METNRRGVDCRSDPRGKFSRSERDHPGTEHLPFCLYPSGTAKEFLESSKESQLNTIRKVNQTSKDCNVASPWLVYVFETELDSRSCQTGILHWNSGSRNQILLGHLSTFCFGQEIDGD